MGSVTKKNITQLVHRIAIFGRPDSTDSPVSGDDESLSEIVAQPSASADPRSSQTGPGSWADQNATATLAHRQKKPTTLANASPSTQDAVRIVTDREKYAYVRPRATPMAVLGLLSSTLLLIGLTRFAITEYALHFAFPFLMVNGVYLALSYLVMFSCRPFSRTEHEQIVHRWLSHADLLPQITVDVFLPVCGEDPEVILETWRGVRDLRWPGPVNVYVLDDSQTDLLRADAESMGFHYLRRSDRSFRKAGNLRHGFANSSGDFILLLDADFRPRADMLVELIPYLLDNERLALVQSPQYFDVNRQQNWLEAGAGYVQELFYRLIQPARERWNAAVCVGSCAVYRRAALAPMQGAVAIEHSEDMWTGFELLNRGWRVRYLPIVLAKGLCPDQLTAFTAQQYRWCSGSLSLVASRRFWQSSLTAGQKICFAGGFFYYLATAFNTLLTPLPPLIMVCCFPQWVHWHHLAFSILALIYTPFLIGLWSVYPFGVHFLTAREVSGAAHLHAVIDWIRGSLQPWRATGSSRKRRASHPFPILLSLLCGTALLAAGLTWAGTVRVLSLLPDHWFHFVPPVLFTMLHAAVCTRFLFTPTISVRAISSWSAAHRRNSAFAAGLVVLLVMVPCTVAGRYWSRADASRLWALMADPATPDPFVPFNLSPAADFGNWTLTDAFPGSETIRHVMRVREHPQNQGVYHLATFQGKLLEATHEQGSWVTRTLADLSSHRDLWLYSFHAHPQYPDDPRVFVTYHVTTPSGMALRLSSLTIPLKGSANTKDETILIEQHIESSEHLGGDLAFDSTGCLMISIGDNSASHRDRHSQQLDKGFFSGVLRIDIDHGTTVASHVPPKATPFGVSHGYRIPDDNPFVGMPDILEEYWALGLRNPFRISFDAAADRLWIGDVGQDRREQIEIARAGTNHQWSYREGSLPFRHGHLRGERPADPFGESTPPFYEYPHDDLNYCVIGGCLYDGDKFPELTGRYIFGDMRSGRIWSIHPEHPEDRELLVQLPFTKAASSLVSISTDQAGNILFSNFASWPAVYRLGRSEQIDFPQRLSQTGFFQSLTPLELHASFQRYDVNAPLWSDGMHKTRWVRLPRGRQIDNSDSEWAFPVGTVFVKHFQRPGTPGDAQRPIETRILVMRDDGTVTGAAYLWNAAENDASLQTNRRSLTISSGTESFEYVVPGYRDCRVCHHRNRPVLGMTPEQINRRSLHSRKSQLIELSERGFFRFPYSSSDVGRLPTLAGLDDVTVPVEKRARSYLHSNCSFCHTSESLEQVSMDLRHGSPDSAARLIGTPAKMHYQRIDGRRAEYLIAPGDPENSAIFRRMRTCDASRKMPFLGRSTPDRKALKVMEQWIRSLDETSVARGPSP